MEATVNTPSTDPRARKLRVLFANASRSYREALALVIRRLRPGVEVATAEPDDLDNSIRRFAPDIVVCSEATDVARTSVPVWVELYPGHGSRSVANIFGRQEEYAEIQLPDLLSIVDRAEDLVR
jgi:hypothetical protein